MPVRFWLLRLLLLASLLFGQVAGFAHALTHLAPGAPNRVIDKGLTHHSSVCDLCATYDAMGSAPTAAGFRLPPVPLATLAYVLLAAAAVFRFSFPYRSRAPPTLI